MATTLTADNLHTPQGLQTTPPVVDTTPYGSIIAGIAAQQPDLQNTVDQGQKTITDSLDTYKSLSDALLGKTAYTADQNKAAGVDAEKANLDQYNQDLNSINANISGLSNEAKAIPLEVQARLGTTGRLATDAGVAPEQTGLLRNNAIKALTQASLADITQANITNSTIRYNAAKDKAQQAVDLKYKPMEDQLAQLKDQLALNKTYITDPAEKKLADNQQKLLDERSRLLVEKKQNDKDISDMIIDANANKAPKDVLDNANNIAKSGGTPAQVAMALGHYSSAAGRAALLAEQLKTEKLNQDKLSKEINGTGDDSKVLSIDDAAKLGVPYGTTVGQAKATSLANVGKPVPLNPTQTSALESAQALMTKLNNDFNEGGLDFKPNAPVGTFNSKGLLLNQKRADFVVQFDNLKGLLALDAAKLVKGQGALSDSERKILDDAASALNRKQSPEDFKKNLQTIIDKFQAATPDGQYVNSITSVLDSTNSAVQSPEGYAATFTQPTK